MNRNLIYRALHVLLSLTFTFDASAATLDQIQPNDQILMTVFQEDTLRTETRVTKGGTVSLPLIGSVKIGGLTASQAEAMVKKLYETDYIKRAHVNISVVAYAKKFITVGGDVAKPGMIEYPDDSSIDIKGAIAQAGGFLETADASRVLVRSGASGREYSASMNSQSGTRLDPGDLVTVTRSDLSNSTITITGQVASPGSIPYPKEGGLDILTAIATAGGMSKIANTKSVILKRAGGKSAGTFEVDLRSMEQGKTKLLNLIPGDIVIVRESRF